MKKTTSDVEKTEGLTRSSSSYLPKDEFRDRRHQEMKRRFGILQSKRTHLERELEAVKISLVSLDQQMQSYAAYKQLSMHRA